MYKSSIPEDALEFVQRSPKSKSDIIVGDRTVLRKTCEPIEYCSSWDYVANEMAAVMNAAGGIGLAAPQVGLLYRIIVLNVDGEEYRLFNPEIIHKSKFKNTSVEGCLSFPGIRVPVPRHDRIMVKALMPESCGIETMFECGGLLSYCMQHEIDHLNGVLHYDYMKDSGMMNRKKRKTVLKRIKNLNKGR